jgi:hypothetical protein
MLLTHFIWQTVLKPLSGTNALLILLIDQYECTTHTTHRSTHTTHTTHQCQERSSHPFSHSYNADEVLQCRQVGAGNMERYNQFIEVCRSSRGGLKVAARRKRIANMLRRVQAGQYGGGGGLGGHFVRASRGQRSFLL